LFKIPTTEKPIVRNWVVRNTADGDIEGTFNTEQEAERFIRRSKNRHL